MPRATGNVSEYAYLEQFNDNYQNAWMKWLGSFKPELVMVGTFKKSRHAKGGGIAKEWSNDHLAADVVETFVDDLDDLTVSIRDKRDGKILQYLGVTEGLKTRYRDGGERLKVRLGLKGFNSAFAREAIEFIASGHWEYGTWGFDCAECKWLDREFDKKMWNRNLIKDHLIKNPDRILTNLNWNGR